MTVDGLRDRLRILLYQPQSLRWCTCDHEIFGQHMPCQIFQMHRRAGFNGNFCLLGINPNGRRDSQEERGDHVDDAQARGLLQCGRLRRITCHLRKTKRGGRYMGTRCRNDGSGDDGTWHFARAYQFDVPRTTGYA